VPLPHIVVLRGGRGGEGGIRTLGTVARRLDWGCPAPCSARPAPRACALPASPKFRARSRSDAARGMGEAAALLLPGDVHNSRE
jgi:hypothetical protein